MYINNKSLFSGVISLLLLAAVVIGLLFAFNVLPIDKENKEDLETVEVVEPGYVFLFKEIVGADSCIVDTTEGLVEGMVVDLYLIRGNDSSSPIEYLLTVKITEIDNTKNEVTFDQNTVDYLSPIDENPMQVMFIVRPDGYVPSQE